jgi:hypothetical protein
MDTAFDVEARDVRKQLIETIRSDKAFAEALVEDPAAALTNTELGARIVALNDPGVQGFKKGDGDNNASICCLWTY